MIEADVYAQKANRVVVLNDADEVVAVLEIVSPGNKSNLDRLNQFVEKALQFIRSGIHFFFVDLLPPTSRDPQGLHAAIWSEMVEYSFQLPAGKPLIAASGWDKRACERRPAVWRRPLEFAGKRSTAP